MRHAVLALVFAVAGCKGMGGVASGVGHAMSGVGHVASGFGKVASAGVGAVAHVAAPVGVALAKAAPVVTKGAGVVAKGAAVAIDAAQLVLPLSEPMPEGSMSDPVWVDASTFQPTFDGEGQSETQDLCLDCPDAGNCNSCLEPR